MTRGTSVLLLATTLAAGCGAASTKSDNWAYFGSDPAYRNPPLMPRGSLTNTEWQADIQLKMQEWHRWNREAIEESKAACAGQAGESSAFAACMKARGWAKVSNPL